MKLQANATDSWGTPTVDAAATIPADDADGRVVYPWLDVTAATGYSSGGFRYWRLHVSGTNSVALQLGEVWVGSTKRLLATAMGHNYKWGFEVGESRRLVEHITEYGVSTVYDLQTRRRTFRGDLRLSDTGLTAFKTWVRSMKGRVEPAIWIPDSTTNEAWWVRQVRDWSVIRRFTNLIDVTLLLDELSHGLPL